MSYEYRGEKKVKIKALFVIRSLGKSDESKMVNEWKGVRDAGNECTLCGHDT